MKHIILFSIIISLGLASCKKQEQMPTDEKNSLPVVDLMRVILTGNTSATPTYGTTSFLATKYGFENPADTTPNFGFNGDFFSTSTQLPADRIEVGDISNGLYSMSADPSNSLNYTYNTTQRNDPNNASLFGSTISFSASGSATYGIPSFSQKIYNPSILSVTGTFTGGIYNTHSKSQPISLNWNPDTNNPYTNIVVMLEYKGGPSVRLNASNPTSIPLKTYRISDKTGTFTIPVSDLALYPQNCVMNVFIIRGNIEVATVDGKDYEFICYSQVMQEFELQE